MSAKALAIEDAIVAMLSASPSVAARVASGDAVALPKQDADGVIVRVRGLDSIDYSLGYEAAGYATFSADVEVQRLGPVDVSAVRALQVLVSAVHARLMADRTLSGSAQHIQLQADNAIDFETTAGGEQPVHSATMRYQIQTPINLDTLGA